VSPKIHTWPIGDRPLSQQRGAEASGDWAYYLPRATCSTCFRSTRDSFHERCRRDEQGRLLVVQETLQR
jgi:hypothetical protein